MSFKIMLITIFSSIIFCFSQAQQKVINGIEFKIVISKTEYGGITFMELYRNNKKIVRHILSEIGGDCSSENVELGQFEVKGSNLIFYTYWASGDRMNRNIYPYGFRKQIYSVNKKGFVHLNSSKIYIEAYVDGDVEHKGMRYLKQKPKSNKELELMNDYISKSKKIYFGTFVFGKNKDLLENQVRKKIGKTILENTENWKEIFGKNCRM